MFPAKRRRPATLSVHISVDLAIETCEPPLLDSFFFRSLPFLSSFLLHVGCVVLMPMCVFASDNRHSADRA